MQTKEEAITVGIIECNVNPLSARMYFPLNLRASKAWVEKQL
jgi:hypothetical protein